MFRRFLSAALWPNYGPFVGLLVACLLGIAPKASAQVGSVPGLIVQGVGKGIDPNPPLNVPHGPYKGPKAAIYIDGKRKNDAALTKLNPDDIADIAVMKLGFGSLLKPARRQVGALVITTKAGQNTQAVQRFNKRVAKMTAHSAAATPVVD
jgi:hypothetical protein